MGKAADASMNSTVESGRKMLVCCPPCIEKIKADPTSASPILLECDRLAVGRFPAVHFGQK